MLAWILLIFIIVALVLSFIVGLIKASKERDFDYFYMCMISGIFFCVLPTTVLTVVISEHAHDLGTKRNAQKFIDVRQEAIADIDKQLESLKDQMPQSSLLNADTPVASLIETKANFVQQIADTRIEIVEAETDIERRSIGLMSGVVDWYGKE